MSLRSSTVSQNVELDALELVFSLVNSLDNDDLYEFIVELDDSVGDNIFTEKVHAYFQGKMDRWAEIDAS